MKGPQPQGAAPIPAAVSFVRSARTSRPSTGSCETHPGGLVDTAIPTCLPEHGTAQTESRPVCGVKRVGFHVLPWHLGSEPSAGRLSRGSRRVIDVAGIGLGHPTSTGRKLLELVKATVRVWKLAADGYFLIYSKRPYFCLPAGIYWMSPNAHGPMFVRRACQVGEGTDDCGGMSS